MLENKLYDDCMQLKKMIVVTGGSGFIGTQISKKLIDDGYSVVVLDIVAPRIAHKDVRYIHCDLSKDLFPKELEGEIYGIIHLAGKNIFGRWSKSYKKQIYDSRILSTRNIVSEILKWQVKPSVYVGASAFGYYGNKGDTLVDENASAGTDFLSQVCINWETEAKALESAGIRTVFIRTAHVLGNEGLLAPLFVPFRFGLGAWIGNGKAWLPWIHVDDVVSLYVFALTHGELTGPVNACADEPVRQKDFMKHFGKAMHKWVLFSIPIFILKIRYGELAETFNTSVKMTSGKLKQIGFVFEYPNLDSAFQSIVKK